MNTLFRDPPSAALKIAVLAAIASYIGVAATHVQGCFPHTGECLLLSPAVLVYWAPAFVAVWIASAVLVKLVSPRQRVLPLVTYRDDDRESALLRTKGEWAFSLMVAAFSYLGLQAVVRAIATRSGGAAHDAAAAFDRFLASRPGIVIWLVAGMLATYAVLRLLRRPADDELS